MFPMINKPGLPSVFFRTCRTFIFRWTMDVHMNSQGSHGRETFRALRTNDARAIGFFVLDYFSVIDKSFILVFVLVIRTDFVKTIVIPIYDVMRISVLQ